MRARRAGAHRGSLHTGEPQPMRGRFVRAPLLFFFFFFLPGSANFKGEKLACLGNRRERLDPV